MFSSWIFLHRYFFDDINHGYRAVILKENSLWLLPFYFMTVPTYFYYEKVRRTMHTSIVSYLLNTGFWYGSFVCNDSLLILVPSSRKRYFSFMEKVFVLEKICFKFKILKTFKVFTDSRIKTCWPLKRRTILKIPITAF